MGIVTRSLCYYKLVQRLKYLFHQINKSLPVNYLQWNGGWRGGVALFFFRARHLHFHRVFLFSEALSAPLWKRSMGNGRRLLYLHEPTLKFSQVRNEIIFKEVWGCGLWVLFGGVLMSSGGESAQTVVKITGFFFLLLPLLNGNEVPFFSFNISW